MYLLTAAIKKNNKSYR